MYLRRGRDAQADPRVTDRSELDPGGEDETRGSVDLYWIPLGADADVVRISGKLFEFVTACGHRRPRRSLYHSALLVHVPEGRFVIEQAPIPDLHGERRGVVAEGPVGTRWAGRFRLFRYEIRRWREGRIPDLHSAVESPVRLTHELAQARRVLDVVPLVPTPVWGRDELHLGEMWNSNSVIAWVLSSSGCDITRVAPPDGGRAPGWKAGVVAGAAPFECEESGSLTADAPSGLGRSVSWGDGFGRCPGVRRLAAGAEK